MTEAWRLAAIRIGSSNDRRLGLLVGGESLDATVELAYFVWCIRQESGDVVVVDAGFRHSEGVRRNVLPTQPITESLSQLGIEPADVTTVVLTHLHWDHMGDFRAFPKARFLVGRDEWAWTTAQATIGGPMFDSVYDGSAICELATLPPGRIELVEGGLAVGPTATVRIVGGHTCGHAIVMVRLSTGGHAVLLGDLAYLYANLRADAAPFICDDRWHTRDLYHELRQDPRAMLVPGHDPAVLDTLGTRVNADIAVCR